MCLSVHAAFCVAFHAGYLLTDRSACTTCLAATHFLFSAVLVVCVTSHAIGNRGFDPPCTGSDWIPLRLTMQAGVVVSVELYHSL